MFEHQFGHRQNWFKGDAPAVGGSSKTTIPALAFQRLKCLRLSAGLAEIATASAARGESAVLASGGKMTGCCRFIHGTTTMFLLTAWSVVGFQLHA